MGRVLVLVSLLVVLSTSAAAAQELEPLEPGVEAYVPIVESIVIDGDLSDWSNISAITTSTGPTPPADPANTGSVTWRVAAVGERLMFSASVVDSTIIAGQHGEDYWNEDSVELYLNFSGNQQATSYGPGILQLTLSPVDIGNTDPALLTISGNNTQNESVMGFVFATGDGWGVEVELDLTGLTVPTDQATFGLQVQANGSSGGDRDTKLSWSVADVADSSFNDPSVFGTGIFVDQRIDLPSQDDVPVEDSVVPASDDLVESDDAIDGVSIDEAAVGQPVDEAAPAQVVSEEIAEAEGRGLLFAAVLSAAAIMGGGFWFEHRRKADELRRATAMQLAIGPAESEHPE